MVVRAPRWLVVLAAVVALGAGSALSGVPAGAQGLGSVAADRVAPVGVDPEAPPETQISGLWLDPVPPADDSSATVVVGFSGAFPLPATPWRVSVWVGDPLGTTTRASMVAVDQSVSGLVERGDGARWTDEGPTVVVVGDDGRVTIDVPLEGAGPASSVRAEAETTVDGEVVTSTTAWFALEDLLGERPGPALGVAPVAGAVEDPAAPPLVLGDPGPTVAVVGRSLEVTTTTDAPTQIDGEDVVALVDTVVIRRPGDGGARIDRIEIDRGDGEVRLVPADAGPVVAEPGVSPWLVNPPSATAPGAPTTVTFDLEALDVALGGPVLDRDTTAVGLVRTIVRPGDRSLEALGVAGTMAWFDAALVDDAAPPEAPSTADGPGTSGPSVVIVAAAGLAVAIVAVLLVGRLVRRRRRPPPGPPEVPAEPPRRPVPPVAVPVVAPDPLATDPGSPAVSPGASVHPPADEARPDPLAAFLAEVDELSDRVDRLGGEDTPR